MQVGITKLPVPRFSDSKSTCTLYDIFLPLYRNQIFGLDISIFFDVLNSNVGLTPSVFKNGTSDYTFYLYKSIVKIIENMHWFAMKIYSQMSRNDMLKTWDLGLL